MTDWKFVDVDGITTRYRESGSGHPILLVHGGEFGAGSADTWPEEYFEILGRHNRVVAVDRLGAGHTDNPAADDGYRMSAVTEHTAAFMRQLGLTGATVIGQSRGAYVITRVAKDHPDLVDNVVIVNSASISVRFPAEPVPSMLNHVVYGSRTNGESRHDAQIMSVTHEHITDEWVALRNDNSRLAKNVESRAAMKRVWTELFAEFETLKADLLKWMIGGGYHKPTLIIWGVGDPTTTLRDGTDLFEILQPHVDRLRMHVINRSGHWPHREYPAETATEIAHFLDEL